jgi:hypothetical protein
LVWNFDDNNFTWMDASVIVDGALSPVACIQYGFDPGWVARWDDLTAEGVTWDDLTAGTDPWSGLAGRPAQWSDFYSAGEEKNMYWLTDEGVWKSDQVIYKGSVKSYYLERTQIDLDDLVQQWTSYNYTYVRQAFPLMQSPRDAVAPSTYTFEIGQANNLMDPPNYKPAITVDLLPTASGGKHKIDFRSTARYHSMRWTFNLTDKVTFTAVDIDAQEAHGR